MENLPVLDFAETMAGLPEHIASRWDLDKKIQGDLRADDRVIVILDDDPTGTQTVHDVPVLTGYTAEEIKEEVRSGSRAFFILTNSRSLSSAAAAKLAEHIGENIRLGLAGYEYLIVIRGDSTLRGHFPVEDNALIKGLGMAAYGFVHYLIPAFFEGGRYTINDVHYARQGENLVPVAQTAFAKDNSFGYESSDLKNHLSEKSDGEITMDKIMRLTLENIRRDEIRMRETVMQLWSGCYCIVNATDYEDLRKVIWAILDCSDHPIFRTSASFIKALLGQPDRPLLKLKRKAEHGGLIVVGSHVPKTTAQLAHLQSTAQLSEYEVDVRALLSEKPALASRALAQKISEDMREGKDVLLYTSREVITTEGADANLDIAAKVSAYLEETVAELTLQPSFLLTKGGITSSRIATEALGVKRAMALGQVQPGVPTWELGPESKFPGMPFIIYPGNVGGVDGLSSILENTII